MNNNRGSNRRRGRGNNRQQGGNQGNRIDSRARGNAPQLLEKYKKLAHDASLNGDRVQAEYYLQFADHYFRVLADSRALKEEQRGPRREGEREPSYDHDDQRDYDEQPREHRAPERRNGGERHEREDRDERDERDEFEPAENPFTREVRGRRPDGEREERGGRRAPRSDDDAGESDTSDDGRFDPSSLPPSFASTEREEKPRRKPRKPKAESGEKAGDRGDEELETVS